MALLRRRSKRQERCRRHTQRRQRHWWCVCACVRAWLFCEIPLLVWLLTPAWPGPPRRPSVAAPTRPQTRPPAVSRCASLFRRCVLKALISRSVSALSPRATSLASPPQLLTTSPTRPLPPLSPPSQGAMRADFLEIVTDLQRRAASFAHTQPVPHPGTWPPRPPQPPPLPALRVPAANSAPLPLPLSRAGALGRCIRAVPPMRGDAGVRRGGPCDSLQRLISGMLQRRHHQCQPRRVEHPLWLGPAPRRVRTAAAGGKSSHLQGYREVRVPCAMCCSLCSMPRAKH